MSDPQPMVSNALKNIAILIMCSVLKCLWITLSARFGLKIINGLKKDYRLGRLVRKGF